MDHETNILFREESYQVLGACFEVYKQKGCGFSEAVYHECLGIELEFRGIPHFSKPRIELEYRGRTLSQHFEPDFMCYGTIVLELKALPKLLEVHRMQVMNYLKATGMKLGLLANFGHAPRLDYLRIAAHDHWAPFVEANLQA